MVVKNKTPHGFDVVELGGGASSMPFQWHIVGNRADEAAANGRVSRNADARFEVYKGHLQEAPVRVPEKPATHDAQGLGLTPASVPGVPAGSMDWLRVLLPTAR